MGGVGLARGWAWSITMLGSPVPVVVKSVGEVGERGNDEGATNKLAPDRSLSAEIAGLGMLKLAPSVSASGRSAIAAREAPDPETPLLGKDAGGSLDGERLRSESSSPSS